MSTRSHLASSAGKFETLGSNFSQETPLVATGVLILQSKKSSFLRIHVIPKKRKKTSHCSMSTRSQSASSAGKFETLGSNFSNETRICEATGVLILQFQEVFYLIRPQP